jgi:hypothetical protein
VILGLFLSACSYGPGGPTAAPSPAVSRDAQRFTAAVCDAIEAFRRINVQQRVAFRTSDEQRREAELERVVTIADETTARLDGVPPYGLGGRELVLELLATLADSRRGVQRFIDAVRGEYRASYDANDAFGAADAAWERAQDRYRSFTILTGIACPTQAEPTPLPPVGSPPSLRRSS